MSTIALGFESQADIPVDLRIPPRPRTIGRPTPPEPAWREAMRWSMLAMTASLAAGEVALFLFGP